MYDADICNMKERLCSAMCSQIEEGLETVNTEEAGQVIDMIKDLAQAEYYKAKTEYYTTVKEAMEYGSRSGYVERIPYDHMDEDRFAEKFKMDPHMMRMGYTDHSEDMKYSKAYREWQNARRHYTQTNSSIDKDEMNVHAREHLSDTISSMKEIWKNADPDLRKRMKSDLTTLISEMTV